MAGGELGAGVGVFHEFDAVAVGVGEPGLEGVVEAGFDWADLDASGEEGGAEGFEAGDFEAEVAVAVAVDEGLGGAAPLEGGAGLVEEFEEGGIADLDVGAEAGAVGGGEAELGGEAEGVAVEGDETFEVVGEEAEVGEAADHVGGGGKERGAG